MLKTQIIKPIKTLGKSLAALTLFFSSFTLFYSSNQAQNQDNNPNNSFIERLKSTSITREELSTVQDDKTLKLNLKDAINLTLENNRTLKDAYLQRIIDREDLAQANALYTPELTPTIDFNLNRNRILSGAEIADSGNLNLGGSVFFLIPTGATIRANLDATGASGNRNTIDFFRVDNSLEQNFNVTFTQPLFRGFGTAITNIPIVRAEGQEDINLLDLKDTLINTITETIRAYRSLIQAQESLKIQQQALERAKAQLKFTQILIEAGRRARVDIIQNQTQVAERELTLLQAKNTLKNQQLNLIQALDIDRDFQIIAIDIPQSEALTQAQPLKPKELLQLAFINNPNYLRNLINIDLNRLSLLEAKDDNRWQLDLILQYSNDLDILSTDLGNSNVSAALFLSKDFFGNRALQRNIIRFQVTLDQSLIRLEERKENLTIDVENGIRQVNFTLQQAKQARVARILAAQRLQIEQEKQRLGRGSLFELITFEQNLVDAQNRELNAIIDYLNQLTSLNQTLGITLDIWDIQFDRLSVVNDEKR